MAPDASTHAVSKAVDRSSREYRWTLNDYHLGIDLGLFESKQIELIRGKLIEMSPQSNDHIIATQLAHEAMRAVFGSGYVVRCQLPFTAVDDSEPEPDVSVVTGSIRDANPKSKTPLLTLEVSASTLEQDRSSKANLYAESGISEYWILNLKSRCLEVHRQPDTDEGRYTQISTLQPSDSITPLARPDAPIKIEDLLP
ncbi:MAG: Uma2 family endonuclease [Planctomycetota bacterium]